MGNFLKDKLFKTREGLFDRFKNFISGKKITKEITGEIEEILISSDISSFTSKMILDRAFESSKNLSKEEFIESVKNVMLSILKGSEPKQGWSFDTKPLAIMVVGVNGVGKTTTIWKISKMLLKEGKSGMLAACDTFRGAAVEQLEVLGSRVGLRVIKQKIQADPASVAFDALKAAISAKSDFLILDTAGRLHTKHNLMEELKKIKRVLGKENRIYPQEILLVLDATFGQNALSQVKEYSKAVGVSGIVMAKMDGTAKGGVLLSLAGEHHIPVKFIGVGEGENDLIPFNAEDFVDAIFS